MSSNLSPIVETALANNVEATTVTVDLISSPVFANWEYTDGSISSAYASDFQAFATIFNQGSTFGTLAASQQAAEALAARDAIFGLPTDPSPNATNGLINLASTPQLIDGYYNGLTVSMASNLDAFLRSLQAAGWNGQDPGTDTTSAAFASWTSALNNWVTLSQLGSTVQGVLQGAASAVQTNTTFQAALESSYVGTANDLVEAQLTNLQTQLQSSQNVLDTLTSVQNIHNDITVSGKGSINFVYLNGATVYGSDNDKGFNSAYTQAASAHFGEPLIPHIPSSLVTFGTPPISSPALQAIETQEAQLKATIDANLAVMNGSINAINATINSSAATEANSNYQAAVNAYNGLITNASNNNIQITETQLLAAQQTYITAANQYNAVFWQGRLWPPVLDENSVNVDGKNDQGNGYEGLQGDLFQGSPENPSSPLIDSTETDDRDGYVTSSNNVLNQQQGYTLSWQVITNPFATDSNGIADPTTESSFGSTDDPGNYSSTYTNLADYINAAFNAYNGTGNDGGSNQGIINNYNNVISQLNSSITSLNSQIAAYNKSNPTAMQVSALGAITPYDQLKPNSDNIWTSSTNNGGTGQPVIDGSEQVPINSDEGDDTTYTNIVNPEDAAYSSKNVLSGLPSNPTFGDLYKKLYNGSTAVSGAGIVTPGNDYLSNPFSAYGETLVGGSIQVASNITDDPLYKDINNSGYPTGGLPTFGLGTNGIPVTDPVTGFAFTDKEGRPILAPVSFTHQGSLAFQQLLADRSAIYGEISGLQSLTPKVATTSGGTTYDPSSLLVQLRVVITDMNSQLTFNGSPVTLTTPLSGQLTAFNNWILDDYQATTSTLAGNAGLIQQNITNAVVAAQSANNSQQTSVQQYMFVFQEYYQSATSILQALTQLIQQIAQNISQ